jgi:transcriptional regulator GlxA family with amidase domain
MPLTESITGQAYRELVSRQWLPLMDAFEPQLVFISAGFDAHIEDTISTVQLTEQDYHWITCELVKLTKIKPGIKRIAAVMYKDFVALDLTGPIEAFNYVNLLVKEELGREDCGYHIELLAVEAGPVQSMSGVKSHADRSFVGFREPLDILLVPGIKFGTKEFTAGHLPQWIAAMADKCERLVSVCSDSLILAHSGLLKGQKVTTHWNSGSIIRDNFTGIEVDDSQIYCKSGKVYSSAGVTAGIDLALSIIE